MAFRLATMALFLALAAGPQLCSFGQSTGLVEIDILEDGTETPLSCRVKILDAMGRPVRARGTLFESGWNLVENPLLFKGRIGDYSYQVFHGPQFSPASGGFTLDKNSEGYDVLRLIRHADLRSEGWIGGDMLCFAPPKTALRWLPAEDLQMAAKVSNGAPPGEADGEPNLPASSSPWVEDFAYHDTRVGSGLSLHHWLPPAEVPASLPSSRLLVLAKTATSDQSPDLPVHAEIQKLWTRDVPIWLASGHIDSIQLLSEHLTIDGKTNKFSPTVDPAPRRFRGDRGPGKLVEHLYWQVLEAGLRIPPSAGSGFGKTSSPLGYNRVYAFTPSETQAAWWKAVRDGKTFVTSGPLLRAVVNGQRPGAVFSAPVGQAIELDVALTLTVADPVEYLDVIYNGETLYQARLDEHAKRGGKIPSLSVKQSGWLVVRVVTEREHTYRIATTAPYYCEVGGTPRISRVAVELFQRWLETAAEQIAATNQAEASLPYITAARKFWQTRLEAANAP